MPRKLIFLAILIVLGGAVLRRWLSDDSPVRTPLPAGEKKVAERASRSGRSPSRTVTNEIPDFDSKMTRGEVDQKVTRDVFRFFDRPTPVPPTPVPPPTPIPLSIYYIYPSAPTPTPRPTPIVPPSIPYTVVGLFGPKDKPIVALEEAGKLLHAREGDILADRFIVKKINRESIDIAFKDLPPEITRRLPVPGPDSRR